MYKCSKCGLGVMVVGLPQPIRACSCKVLKELPAKGFFQKIRAFFGKKFYIEQLASITCDMNAKAEGKSQFRQN